MKEKDFKELLKTFHITKDLGDCEDTLKVLEKVFLERTKKDLIKKIEAIKSTEEMKDFTLQCAKATLYDYEKLLNDMKDLKEKKEGNNE